MKAQIDQRNQTTAPRYAATDPHKLADAYLAQHGQDSHRQYTLRHWRDEFWQFHEGRYRRISHSELHARVTRFIRERFERTKPTNRHKFIVQVTRNVVGNVVLALTGIVHVPEYLEQPILLGTREQGAAPFFVFSNGMVSINGLLAARDERLRQHSARWFTQTSFPYDYDPTVTCPQWLAFLNQVLESDAERIALVQEWFGYCLTNDTSQQRFIVAVGDGGNGKSVTLDVLAAVLGHENVSHIPVEIFGQQFHLTMTLGKLANISYDAGKIGESAEGAIKQFTGGDRMYFNRKGIPGINAYPTARLILATNHEPHFEDRSEGIWRRMLVVPFNVSIPREQQDPQLAAKLKRELAGIFNWSVEGLRRLRAQGRFTVPAASAEALDELQHESNPAREFLTTRYSSGGADHTIGCADLHAAYRQWCGEQRFKPLDANHFGKEVRKAFPKAERVRGSTGNREYLYRGIQPADDLKRDVGDRAALAVHQFTGGDTH